MKSIRAASLIAALAVSVPAIAVAQAADPARAPVQSLSDALIAAMRGGARVGFAARAAQLRPVVTASFDFATMTRLIVGAPWTAMSASDRDAITAAFARFTVAQYARNFRSFSGQSITVAPAVEARATDRLVRTSLNQPGHAAVPIAYRLRQNSAGQWRIIDVFYNNAISQLATRRADFATILARGGAAALVRHIDALTARAAA